MLFDGIYAQVDVNTEVGIIRDIRLKELRLYTDYGRCSRPLFIVENQMLLIKKRDILALQQRVMTTKWIFIELLLLYSMLMPVLYVQESAEEYGWHDLVRKGFIEYVDTAEEETTMISMTVNVNSL